jgi:hypothetical protein
MCLLGPPADGAGLVESQGLLKEAMETVAKLEVFYMDLLCREGSGKPKDSRRGCANGDQLFYPT